MPGENVNYATIHSVYVGSDPNLKAYVTNERRLLFYGKRGGLLGTNLLSSDNFREIPLSEIRNIRIVESGLFVKSMVLHLDNMQVKGDRGDILNLHMAIQKQKRARG